MASQPTQQRLVQYTTLLGSLGLASSAGAVQMATFEVDSINDGDLSNPFSSSGFDFVIDAANGEVSGPGDVETFATDEFTFFSFGVDIDGDAFSDFQLSLGAEDGVLEFLSLGADDSIDYGTIGGTVLGDYGSTPSFFGIPVVLGAGEALGAGSATGDEDNQTGLLFANSLDFVDPSISLPLNTPFFIGFSFDADNDDSGANFGYLQFQLDGTDTDNITRFSVLDGAFEEVDGQDITIPGGDAPDIPSPQTLLLLAAGAGGLAAVRRRRQRTAA